MQLPGAARGDCFHDGAICRKCCRHAVAMGVWEMKPEAQRICLAEVCGWRYEKSHHEYVRLSKDSKVYHFERDLPDYLNDRNATWQAAEQLGEPVIKAMRFWLFKICGEMKAHHATAAQETEAILRVIGKWTEDEF